MPLNHPHAEVRIGDIQGKIETGRNKEHIRRILVRHSRGAPRRWVTESTRACQKFILAFRIVETPLTCILRDELRFQQFPARDSQLYDARRRYCTRAPEPTTVTVNRSRSDLLIDKSLFAQVSWPGNFSEFDTLRRRIVSTSRRLSGLSDWIDSRTHRVRVNHPDSTPSERARSRQMPLPRVAQ